MSELIVFITVFFFGYKRGLRHLRFLQQEGYDPKRYLAWVWEKKAFDRKGSATVFLGWLFNASWAFILLPVIAYFEENPLKQGKVKLAMTARAKRIYGVFMLLYTGASFISFNHWLWIALLFQSIPLLFVLSVLILAPDESRRQKKFLIQAKEQLKKVSPYVIGITGSAGKTSTKMALAHILQTTKGAVFYPKQGINTPMGIAKVLREQLKPYHKTAIIEMGAYHVGSIRRLCDLTPPDAAIITEVGTCHLERFGSRQAICRAKFELAEALKPNSPLVLNGDNPLIRERAKMHRDKTIRFVGFDPTLGPLDTEIISHQFSSKGTQFTFKFQGELLHGQTPLLGKPALFNLAAAFTLATLLEVDPRFAIAALASLEAVSNRLKYTPPYLHDAYNSNPAGFRAALDVMRDLPADRRILMTPGMIELGAIQQEENFKVGEMAAQVCDLVLIVNETNQKALREGLCKGGMPENNILFCCTREDAFELLRSLAKPDDLVLIENDLPDLYEGRPTW